MQASGASAGDDNDGEPRLAMPQPPSASCQASRSALRASRLAARVKACAGAPGIRCCCLTLGLACAVGCAAADAPAPAEHSGIYSLSLERLSELVVTDTKIAQPRDTVTQRLETLRAGDLERTATPQRNLAEYLRYTAGQFVNPLSRNDANWGSYAGLGPKYNSYLLDGLPIDSFADAMSLDAWALEAVEVHKGPASVLYSNYLNMDFAGNETPLAGITNFILKDRIEDESSGLAVGYGSFNTAETRFYHQDRRGRFSYFAGGSYERSDYTEYGLDDSWLHMVKHPQYEKTKLYAKVDYAFGGERQQLSLFAHHTDHRGDTGRPNRDFENSYDTVNATYNAQLAEAWNLRLKAGYRRYDRSWEEDNYPVDLRLRQRDGVRQTICPADLTVNFQHAGNSMLTMGADYQWASYETYETVNEVTARSTGLFLQEKYVTERWVLRAGGRLNDTRHSYETVAGQRPDTADKSWDSQLWSAGARFNATKHLAFYGNIGSSFLAPSAKSVVGTIAAADAGVTGSNGQLPNPALGPEKGIGSDLGFEYRTETGFGFGMRAFYNRIDDAIVDNVVSRLPSQSQSVNAGRARSQGFEVTLDHTVNAGFAWFANFTVTDSQVTNPLDADQDGTAIPFAPTYVANAGVTVRLPLGIVASPRLQVVGDYYDSTSRGGRRQFGSYAVVNLRLQGVLWERPGYSLQGTLDLNNLFDRRYEMPWQFRDPGINAALGLELHF
jgi:iron complex outermembrane recepter protein